MFYQMKMEQEDDEDDDQFDFYSMLQSMDPQQAMAIQEQMKSMNEEQRYQFIQYMQQE